LRGHNDENFVSEPLERKVSKGCNTRGKVMHKVRTPAYNDAKIVEEAALSSLGATVLVA
jgi:hypothetical protein